MSSLGRTCVIACVASLALTSLLIRPGIAAASGKTTDAAYVALGDSYSSGEGLGPFQAGTAVASGKQKNTCHRSDSHAYSDLKPAVVLPAVTDRSFWACSGATVTDIENTPGQDKTPQQYGQISQLSAVGPDTQYITITAGGDDENFGGLGRSCAEGQIHGKIISVSSTPCKTQLDASYALLGDLKAGLETLYSDLLSGSSPSSELVVAGYPRILPTSFAGLGKVDKQPFCTFDHVDGIGSIGMTVTNAMAVASFIASLNTTISDAVSHVASTNPGRIIYSNIYPTSVPRNCKGTTPNATVAGFELSPAGGGIGPGGFVSTATFHPTQAGQLVYANAIESSFNTLATLRNSITFDGSPGTDTPPTTLGSYAMTPFATDATTPGSTVSAIEGPTGNVSLSPATTVEDVANGWATWSNGYDGAVYWMDTPDTTGTSYSLTMTFPANTKATYFYAEPDEFATYDLSATANNGSTSGSETVYGESGAQYFGFYAAKGYSIKTITVSCSDDFAVGEFGIAG
jgi:hypothetical protein